MPRVVVRLPMPLREFAQGQAELNIDVNDIADLLAKLNAQYPGVASRVMSANQQVRPYVNLFVDDQNIKNLDGINTRLQDGDVVSIIPAVAGGASARERRLAELRANIAQVTPSEAQHLQTHGAVLIDVREAEEIASGSPPGAARLGRGFLELRIEQTAPDLDKTLLVMCDGGTRSLFAAEDLQRLGYTDVRSVTGGFSRWRTEGLPIENPQSLSADARERYARHLRLPEVGEAGQLRLLKSRVLLIGAGGLGSPAALYLAAAGVGTLGLVDNDVVDRSNLQRQILHTDARVGTSKVASAQASMLALNPSLNVQTHALRLDSSNVEEVFAGYEVIVDGSDNFATRYLINDACVKLQLPNITARSRASRALCRCSGRRGLKAARATAASSPNRRRRNSHPTAPRRACWASCPA
jgi:MoaD family protein